MTRPFARALTLLAALVLAAIPLASCGSSDPVTEILVVVDTDMEIPSGIDSVTVEATGMQTASGPLSGPNVEPLPRTVGLLWAGGELGPVTVRVTGTLEGAEIVQAVAITSFVEGRSIVLPMFLADICAGRTCADGETCAQGVCGAADVDPTSLAEWTGDTPRRIDAGPQCEPDVEACNGGDDDCDGMVDEDFDLATDPLNCGGCLNPCARSNAMVGCVDRACVITGCEDGFGDCDADGANGCEDDLSGPAHCGSCENACAFPNGVAGCDAGTCTLTGCMAGFEDCNADPSDGCEVALNTLTDCGGCGTACAITNATATCATGTCAVESCDALFDDCNTDLADGCETPTNTLTDCGACGTACAVTGGTATCATGTCAIDTCDDLLGDCNTDASDGCETALTSLTNCGACGTACTVTGGTGVCDTGTCVVDSCDTELGDCNMDASDGCETNIRRDETNCGMCGTVCMDPTPMCMNYACR